MPLRLSKSAKAYHKSHNPEETPPETVMWESLPMEQRRKLWAALVFWAKLGIEIPRESVKVTEGLDKKQGIVVGGVLYVSKFMLEQDMRAISGLMYKLYARTRPKAKEVTEIDILVDTIVDFGERVLGLQKTKAA